MGKNHVPEGRESFLNDCSVKLRIPEFCNDYQTQKEPSTKIRDGSYLLQSYLASDLPDQNFSHLFAVWRRCIIAENGRKRAEKQKDKMHHHQYKQE